MKMLLFWLALYARLPKRRREHMRAATRASEAQQMLARAQSECFLESSPAPQMPRPTARSPKTMETKPASAEGRGQPTQSTVG
eukprot:6213361-Pleurochrysis_carterae.AAC.2